MSTFNVFWGSLGTSIFGNSSSVANNTRSRLPSRLSFHFLWLWSLQAKYLYYSNFLILNLYKGQLRRCLNSLKFTLWKSILCFFLKESLHCRFTYLKVQFAAIEVSPAPLCCSKTSKICVSRKINMAVKRSDSHRSMKFKFQGLQELDKGILQNIWQKNISFQKNTTSTWKKNRPKILAYYKKGSHSKITKPDMYKNINMALIK